MSKFGFIRRRIADTLDFPEDAVGKAFRLQIIGSTAILNGCRKILKYKSEEISALTFDGIITFCGEHLKCVCFFGNTLEIKGEIQGVRIEKR